MQKILHKYVHEIILTIIVVIFCVVKYDAMHLPYFWDELGVYAPGALAMAESGPGLLPAALDTNYSHGHPLLFYFLNALMFRWFGTDVFVGHIIPLLGSVALIVSLYFAFATLLNRRLAIALCLLLIAQPLFFTQSILLLPEVYVALFFVLAITSYLKNRMLWYILFGACAVMTKETGIIIPFIILFAEITIALRTKLWKGVGKRIVFGMIPLFVFVAFVSIQKIQKGWFFFPTHVGLMNESILELIMSTKAFLKFIFFDQGRWILSIIIVAGGITVVFRKWKGIALTRDQIFYFYWLVGGILFCVLNFYMSRYTLFLFAPVLYFFFLSLRTIVQHIYVQMAVVFICIVMGITQMRTHIFQVDTDMGYIEYLHLQQEVMQYTLHTIEPNAKIACNFPLYYAFEDSRTGFLNGSEKSYQLTTYVDSASLVIIAGHGPWLPEFDEMHTHVPDTIFKNDIENFKVYKNIDVNEMK